MSPRLLAAVLSLLLAAPVAGQTAGCLALFGTPFDALVSPRGLTGPAGSAGLLQLGSEAVALRGCGGGLERDTAEGAHFLPVSVQASYRTAYPFDRNNGALWAGRGLAQATSFGGRAEFGPLRITVYPTIAFQENREFALAAPRQAGSPLRYPYFPLDWPQRFGEASYWSIDPGQSSVQLGLGPVELAVSSENLWWGPADRYPILLSSTGPGFPHGRMTVRPLGDAVELGVVFARLDESGYYDADGANDQRLFRLLTAGVRPGFVPGLTLGFAVAWHTDWEGLTGRALNVLDMDGADATGNGLLSAVIDWRMPEADLRIYGEWAREDHWLNLEDLLTEPDHSEAFMLGLEKHLDTEQRRWRLRWELLHLGRSDPQSRRPRASFYTHSRMLQGHTHKGQLLGAAVGPGSNAQFLAIDALSDSRVVGGYLERIRRDDDAYEMRFARDYGFSGHDLELTAGLIGLEQLGPVTVQWDAGVSRRKNRNFIGLDGVSFDFLRETNAALYLTAWWAP